MKIATWNIERPVKDSTRITQIQEILDSMDADIFFLTETNKFIDLGSQYFSFHTSDLSDQMYSKGEVRSSIYSKCPSLGKIRTFNEETAICEVLDTPNGKIALYATIIGIYGNRHTNFKTDLELQMQDFKGIGSQYPVCIAGDFNISFGDNYYFTKYGRDKLNEAFVELELVNLTEKVENNIDHIVVSEGLVGEGKVGVETWNMDKTLSDYIGVVVLKL
ncbi:MAG: endonuclease/exonuclease/phosphatase family protein [Bacteroidia bacterium]|nr:endonuclease/exonuclease/phosphatase family protein [Bacteroidia bacterium]MCF8427303.1 endonuclease/exonuclease/phosphatase family protein [Bacteroidia bacterium]MCF8446216.1 endonuclease/exonuclease/phosphatase family protein [Bacteroidia bacterium]